MALRFWNELSNIEIAKLLIIFGSPTFLSEKMKTKLREVAFQEEDIATIDEIDTLRGFRNNNKKLFELLPSGDSSNVFIEN